MSVLAALEEGNAPPETMIDEPEDHSEAPELITVDHQEDGSPLASDRPGDSSSPPREPERFAGEPGLS